MLKFLKSFPVLVGRYTTHIYGTAGIQECTVFEMTTPQKNDLIVVNGHRESFLLRAGVLWTMRLLATAMYSQLLSYEAGERSGIARIRPIQSALSGDYIKLASFSFASQSQIDKMVFADLEKIGIQEANIWAKRYDLVQVCDYTANEWRLVRPACELRQQDANEKQLLTASITPA